MSEVPDCPECGSTYTYQGPSFYNCPECGHAWSEEEPETSTQDNAKRDIVHDAHGTELQDGDTVTVIKDLKVRGSSSVVKMGTKVKDIRLVDGDHDIDCKIPGIGQMGLESEFVKKVSE